jgi:low temperature requirement protein LtrA
VPVAYRGISTGLMYFDKEYMETVRPDETGVDHSLLAFGKVINDAVSGSNGTEALQRMVKVYLPLTAICGLLLYFLKIRRLPWINQLLALTIIAIYFTPFSGDGTLIHLYYPFVACCFLAIDAWRRQVKVPGLRAIFWCFAYLLSTESFFVFYGQRYEGQAKCFVLGILLVCALMYPLMLTEEKALNAKVVVERS